jgi:hypothetical protein
MVDFFAFVVFFLRVDVVDVDRLVAFAPRPLDTTRARGHLVAARMAARRHAVDPAVLLAIAWNESRFDPRADGAEKNGSRACGLMGINLARCSPVAGTVVDGYMAGAAILRSWLDAAARPRHPHIVTCRKRSSVWQCGMMGYAGGWNALDICNRRAHHGCGYPAVVLQRAARIRGRDAAPY